MPDIQAQSADGVLHSFPDGTKPEVVDRVMKQYAMAGPQKPSEAQQVQAGLPPGPGGPVIPGGKMIPPLNAQQMSFGAMGGQIPSVEQAQNIVSAQKQVPAIVSGIRKGALAMGGASLGSLAPTALTRIATAGAGGALGTGAGSAISGEVPNPKEMAQVGAGMAAGSAVGEAAAPLVKWMTSSKSVGAQLLQQASAKAGNAPD